MRGLASLDCHSPICLVVAMIKQPFWDWELARVAKEASLKDTNRRSSMGMLLITTVTPLLALASVSALKDVFPYILV